MTNYEILIYIVIGMIAMSAIFVVPKIINKKKQGQEIGEDVKALIVSTVEQALKLPTLKDENEVKEYAITLLQTELKEQGINISDDMLRMAIDLLLTKIPKK